MIKKRLGFLITPLIWLLLLCSSQMEVEAQDTIKPKLVLNRTEIDICSDNIVRDFVLGIDIETTISTTDSLYIAEIVILHKKGNVLIDGYLTLGTIFERFNSDYTDFKRRNARGDAEYDTVILQGMNILTAATGGPRLVNFTGRVIGNVDELECFDFIIEDIYLGDDFKRKYIGQYADSTELCLVRKNLPERKISIKGIEDYYRIDSLEDTLRIDLFVEVANKKNITDFNVELKIEDKFFDDIKFSDVYSDYVVVKNTDTNCIIKVDNVDTATINSAKLLTLELVRNQKESAMAVIHCEINEINECSCSMNGESSKFEVDLPEMVSIREESDDKILIREQEEYITLVAKNKITYCKLVDLYGVEVDCRIERVGECEVIFDKTKLASGVYFIRIVTNNKIKQLQNIKLIIN